MIKKIKIIVWGLVFILFSNAAFAINEQYKKRWYFEDWFSESVSPFASQQQLMLQDARLAEMYSNPNWQESFCNQDVVGSIILGIREKSFDYIDVALLPSLSFEVDLRIQYLLLTSDGFEPHIIEETLSVDFSGEGDGTVNTAKNKFMIPGAVMMSVQVLNDFATDCEFLFIESEINIDRRYHFDKSIVGGALSIAYNQYGNQMLNVEWPAIPHVEEYDFEWVFLSSAWVDNSGELNYHTINEILLNENPFQKGATRIQTWKNSYQFPLIQKPGVILFRYRGLGYEFSNDGIAHWVEGKWSDFGVDYSGPNIPASLQSNFSYFVSELESHEPEKNWQIISTYAEDGKNVKQISYADGTNRIRQSLSLSQELEYPIVQETKYDFYGRPALNFMPVPASDKLFTYKSLFNQSTEVGNEEYTYESFDTDDKIESPSILSSNTGAERYYSSTNDLYNSYFDNNLIDQVPYTEGYPFTRVTYTRDNSGRIKKEYMPGETFRPGSNEESYTEHFYAGVLQNDLNRLFGDEVGKMEHYFSHMIKDPNGQHYIEYSDMKGNVIASGLAGLTPESYQQIYQNGNIEYDTIDAYTGFNTINQDTRSSVSNFIFMQTLEQNVELNYVNDGKLVELCSDFCVDCVYDLEILLLSSDGENHFLFQISGDEWGNDTIIGQDIIDVIESGNDYTSSCIQGIQPELSLSHASVCYNESSNSYEICDLPPGSYNVIKRLVVNETALEYYVDEYIENSSCVNPPVSPYISMGCDYNCDSIQADINQAISDGDTEAEEILQEWYVELCEPDAVLMLLGYYQSMLHDVEIGGQYGLVYDNMDNISVSDYHLSVYNASNVLPQRNEYLPGGAAFVPDYEHPYNYEHDASHYYDEEGNVVYIEIDGITYEPQDLTLDEFLTYYDDSWAESLVYYHPEFPYYLMLESLIDSYVYDDLLLSLSYDELQNLEYSPLGLHPNATSPTMPTSGIPDQIFSISDNNWTFFDYSNSFGVITKEEFWELLYDALENFSNDPVSGSDITLWQYVDILDNQQSCAGCTNIPQQLGNTSIHINSEEAWDLFKGFYRQIKLSLLARCYALNAIHYENAYNSCIGNPDYNFSANGFIYALETSNSPHYSNIFLAYFPDFQAFNAFQPCNTILSGLYANKTARFPDYVTQNSQLEGSEEYLPYWNVDYLTWNINWIQQDGELAAQVVENTMAYVNIMNSEFCGQCPETIALFAFIQDFLLGDEDSVYDQHEDSANCVMSGLNNNFGVMLNDELLGVDGNIQFVSYAGATIQELYLDFERNNTSCSILLDLTGTNVYTFDDIESVCCIRPATADEELLGYEFAFTVSVETEGSVAGVLEDFTVLGNISCFSGLFDCEFEPYCSLTSTGRQLQSIISGMLALGEWNSVTSFNDLNQFGMIGPDLLISLNEATNYNGEVWNWLSSYIPPSNSQLDFVLTNGDGEELIFNLVSEEGSDLSDVSQIVGVSPPEYGTVSGNNLIRILSVVNNQYEYLLLYTPGNIYPVSCIDELPEAPDLISSNYNAGSQFENSDEYQIYDNFYTAYMKQYLSQNSLPSIEIMDQEINVMGVSIELVYPGSFSLGIQLDEIISITPDFSRLTVNGTSRFANMIVEDINGQFYEIALKAPDNYFGSVIRVTSQPEYTSPINTILSHLTTLINSNSLSSEATIGTTEIRLNLPYGNYGPDGTNIDYYESNYFTYDSIEAFENIYIDEVAVYIDGQIRAAFEGLARVESNGLVYYELISGVITPFASELFEISWGEVGLYNSDFQVPFMNDGDEVSNVEFNELGFYTDFLNSNGSAWGSNYTKLYFSIDSDISNFDDGDVIDHTNNDPNGNFLSVYSNNSKYPYTTVWEQQVSLEKNTDYAFEFWVNLENLDGDLSDQNAIHFVVKDQNEQLCLPSRNKPTIGFIEDQMYEFVKTHNDFYLTELDTVNIDWKKIRYYFHSYNEGLVNLSIEVKTNSNTSFEKFAIDDVSLLYRMDTDCYEDPNASVVCDSASTNPLCEISLPFNENFSIPQSDCGTMQSIVNDYLQEADSIQYINNLRDSIRRVIIDSCLTVSESLTFLRRNPVNYMTLYYYDQAGNLIKTVPPDGLEPVNYDDFEDINDDRENGITSYQTEHRKATVYKYNSFNQMVSSYMPDHDQMSNSSLDNLEYCYSGRLYYDLLGRVLLSQNTKQRNENVYRYSFTKYDELSRPIESGEVDLNADVESFPFYSSSAGVFDLTNTFWNQFLDDPSYITGKRQVMKTTYSESPSNFPYNQDNLRNRVACVEFRKDASQNNYDVATYYSYDIHGNVKELWHHTPIMSGTDLEYVHLSYSYDLLSGNVNEVIYQDGKTDEFHHKYDYDAANRLTDVWTSRDGYTWERDAEYYYYLHGPLARIEVGDNKVQGQDMAYTIQGWLKAVNRDKAERSTDMGSDGIAYNPTSLNQHSAVAEDAFGYSLAYFEDDYNSGNTSFLSSVNDSDFSPDLYNGNIKRMISTVNQNGNMISDMYSYEYDQLNRLVGMQSYEGNAVGTYSIGNTLGANSSYEYDLDGNLEQLTRHFGLERDDVISYTYPDEVTVGSELRKTSNKLGNITNTGNLPSISSQSSGNYTYDEIGNLISDDGEEIYTIVWTPSGKVAEVIRIANSEKSDLEFRYDAMGNRIFKIEKVKNETGDILAPENWKTTFYSRDAQGNVMATYIGNADANENPANLELLELYMYGSSRLGSIDAEMESQNEAVRSAKKYELTNHLGNVVAVINNQKKPNNLDSDQYIDYFSPVIVSSTTYWPFGLPLEADNLQEYRFGFNGMEKDPEITGQEGSHYTAMFWEYDTRIARRWNVDPVTYPWQSSYATFNNNPIIFTDPLGLFGTREAARNYKKEHGIKGRVRKGDDGMYYIKSRHKARVYHTYRDPSQINRANDRFDGNFDDFAVFTDCVKDNTRNRDGARLTSRSAKEEGYNVPDGQSLYEIDTDDLPRAGRGRQSIRTPKALYDGVKKGKDIIERNYAGRENIKKEKNNKKDKAVLKTVNSEEGIQVPDSITFTRTVVKEDGSVVLETVKYPTNK